MASEHMLVNAAKIPDAAARRRFLEAIPEHARIPALAGAWREAADD